MKAVAEIIIKPNCIKVHGGENEAFSVAMEELRKRYIIWALGEKPRQFRIQLFVEDFDTSDK